MISPDDAVRHTQHYVGSNPTPSKKKKNQNMIIPLSQFTGNIGAKGPC